MTNLLNTIRKTKKISRLWIITICLLMVSLIGFYFLLPEPLFNEEFSCVVTDKRDLLLGARIAKDGQWRFPQDTLVSNKLGICVVEFEDRQFYNHPGVNVLAIARAVKQNVSAGKVKSGGSTITMQVARLYRQNKRRTMLEKCIEWVLALRLECRYSKREILHLWITHAPFGGNVVGAGAASWRYFGHNFHSLSWAEAATLAVLPNSPSLVTPGKNRKWLLHRRNRVLLSLYKHQKIDKETYELAIEEPLPARPYPLPNLAPHLVERVKARYGQRIIKSTIDNGIQQNVNRLVSDYSGTLRANQVFNAAVLVLDVQTAKVLAYVGNTPAVGKEDNNYAVDMISAPRSTGSILKPLLFMAMQQEGLILPSTLVPDIPTRIGGFRPENYSHTYDGAVPARQALARSLNIPTVHLLQQYGIPKFHNYLQKLGMTTLIYPSDHYGLTLILGGAEGRLDEICAMYASMARVLNAPQNAWNRTSLLPIRFANERAKPLAKNGETINQGAAWLTVQALLEVNRPDDESGWQQLNSAGRVAWKTGTSYGFRDAWAVATTPRFVVGVWVGNADGEGRPGLTGIGMAAPLLFKVLNTLPETGWFARPTVQLQPYKVCRHSGYRAGEFCAEVDTLWGCLSAQKTVLCPWHRLIHLDKTGRFRVTSACAELQEMKPTTWFVLPPAIEWYYRKSNPQYKTLPPLLDGCADTDGTQMMEFVYPTGKLRLFIPRQLDGSLGVLVFELAHRNQHATIYWHLDDQFIGQTSQQHRMALSPPPGKHRLTVVDEQGRSLSRNFEVVK